MKKKMINPANMYNSVPFGFSHAALYSGNVLELAGQVAWDAEGNLVGRGDLALQTRQVLNNLRTVLEAVNASAADIVRLRTYVVNHSPDKLPAIIQEINRFYGGLTPAPNTLIGVQALATPELMIEIEATALAPDESSFV
ncbi:RidA family protein [Serratia ureilytica]|uniref:RidA family protein n=1 Tax=Serratia ureilytica TaxID=300181 RepID=UPI001D186DC3|nr:RidA family protein [Serratia ureilytica]MCC4106655.1 RidA family protein [Serratia ureilytica]